MEPLEAVESSEKKHRLGSYPDPTLTGSVVIDSKSNQTRNGDNNIHCINV